MTIAALGATPDVMTAIERASAKSGVGFDYLVATAQRESGLDCQAKSKASSACGLYQFVAQTWLSTLKAHGAEHGLGAYADDIERNGQGQFSVTDPARRSEILALRSDPSVSAALAAELTADNARILSDKLGRSPSNGELYAAHVLGASGAAKLIGLADSAPGEPAQRYFPEAASSNRGLFYDKTGAPVSVQALTARLTGTKAAAPVTLAPATLAHLAGGLRPSIGIPAAEPQSAAVTASASAAPVTATTASATGSLGVWDGIGRRGALALTPQVLAILASLDVPQAGTSQAKDRS